MSLPTGFVTVGAGLPAEAIEPPAPIIKSDKVINDNNFFMFTSIANVAVVFSDQASAGLVCCCNGQGRAATNVQLSCVMAGVNFFCHFTVHDEMKFGVGAKQRKNLFVGELVPECF